MNSIAHVEINVRNLRISTSFWSDFLATLGWKQFDVGHSSVSGFEAPDGTHLFLVQTEERFLSSGFHRKNIGLNHVAFRVDAPEKVDAFADFLKEKSIPVLYGGPKEYSSEYSREHYYAVFFEDPDRIKVEVVFYK
ncbi:MAG: VOC family protein [Candidatus Pacebacteria bacterium]|jgi:catechol 2,3-dioxygenase-like lactoylglutathione lyase family enzyme|nr:VOC family protein [Candidatus Paceibacterota bacterium]